ncbi:hypothetical protein BV898_17300 [Hypsibius exemplaris]|uniref:Uncharacterized protein n=1 Tax=Hypsibius exemplaris TaxID=2072580 RepID=A0A9X6NH02_HYPEX|nr:hypothetical protein BV898_17300 [Hypsibius exemplaris]
MGLEQAADAQRSAVTRSARDAVINAHRTMTWTSCEMKKEHVVTSYGHGTEEMETSCRCTSRCETLIKEGFVRRACMCAKPRRVPGRGVLLRQSLPRPRAQSVDMKRRSVNSKSLSTSTGGDKMCAQSVGLKTRRG